MCIRDRLYDVEQEQNGLYTYQREPKFSPCLLYTSYELLDGNAVIDTVQSYFGLDVYKRQ